MKNQWKGFVAGIVFSTVLIFIGNLLHITMQKIVIYEPKENITLKNGLSFPEGTKFTLEKIMPEGYNIINLELRVHRGELVDFFDKNPKDKNTETYIWFDGNDVIH
jgi:hypothetical protein